VRWVWSRLWSFRVQNGGAGDLPGLVARQAKLFARCAPRVLDG
jgi:hypothetical protein